MKSWQRRWRRKLKDTISEIAWALGRFVAPA